MKYSGIYSGIGVWTLSEANGQCNVTYEILLEIENTIVRLLSYILPVAKIHSKLMKDVLIGLGQQVRLKRDAPNQALQPTGKAGG